MSGRATISASIFAQNKVVLKSGSGAGIVIDTPRAPVSITGCSFHRNEVPTALPGAYGAAVYVESVASTSAVTISDSSFTYNKARVSARADTHTHTQKHTGARAITHKHAHTCTQANTRKHTHANTHEHAHTCAHWLR